MSFLRFGHRGAPREAPENTLASFRAALRHAVDGVELDVRFSRDGCPVVHHDETLARTAGRAERVADLDREALLALDVGSWFGAAFTGELLPDLGAALAAVRPDSRVLAEVKDGPALARGAAESLEATLRRDGAWYRLILISFHEGVLREMKGRIPPLRTGLLVDGVNGDPIDRLAAIEASFLLVRHDGVTADLVSWCARAGYPVLTWTVDEPGELRRVLDCGAGGVVSNRPELLASIG
jgi:glycerophosphoryl diester phosphodiesterase